MDLKWDSSEDDTAPPFDNETDPTIHFWLSQLPPVSTSGPKERKDDKRRSTLDQTVRLTKSAEDLVKRAFGGAQTDGEAIGKSAK